MAACKIAAVGKLQLNNGDKATGSLMSLHDMKITRWRFSRSHGTLITLTPTPLPRGRGKKVRKSDRSADASEASSLASFSLPKKAELSKGVLKNSVARHRKPHGNGWDKVDAVNKFIG